MAIKKAYLLLLILGFMLVGNKSYSQADKESSVVYFTEDISPDGVMKIFQHVKDHVKGNVGIKVHFGEDGNEYFVPATMVEPLCVALS